MDNVKPVIIRGRTIERERLRQGIPDRYPRRAASRQFRQRRSSALDTDMGNKKKLIGKIVISAVLLIAILLFNIIDTPFTKNIVGQVKLLLTEDFLFEDAIGKLKFVENIVPDISTVFSHQKSGDKKNGINFKAPVKGTVVSMYGKATAFDDALKNEGIDILTEENSAFYSAEAGHIAAVETHETFGKSIWISHEDDFFTFYGGCGELDVVKGQKVSRGEKLGSTAVHKSGQSILHFEIWKKDKTCNPLDYIKAGSGI